MMSLDVVFSISIPTQRRFNGAFGKLTCVYLSLFWRSDTSEHFDSVYDGSGGNLKHKLVEDEPEVQPIAPRPGDDTQSRGEWNLL